MTFSVIKPLVQAGIGAAIIPCSSLANPLPDTTTLHFAEPIMLPVGIVQKTETPTSTSVAAAFLDLVRNELSPQA